MLFRSGNWAALDYIAEELYNDREIILEGLQQDWEAITYATETLRADREFAHKALSRSWLAWGYVPKELKTDPEFREKLIEVVQSATSSFVSPDVVSPVHSTSYVHERNGVSHAEVEKAAASQFVAVIRSNVNGVAVKSSSSATVKVYVMVPPAGLYAGA